METLDFDKTAGRVPRYGDMLLGLDRQIKDQAYDIRLKCGQPVAVCGREGVHFLTKTGRAVRKLGPGLAVLEAGELQEIFLQVCGHSVFSHEEEIRQGYVDMGGACRVGVCGTAVTEGGRIRGMREITSLVFRIPRDVPGCGDRLFFQGIDPMNGLLIAGGPASGKTTLLRDLARTLSAGRFGPCRRVVVIDSRGELSRGFDLGPCTDVLFGAPRGEGFEIAIRTLSPEILVCDELSPGELPAVRGAMFAGVALAASVHGEKGGAHSRPLCERLMHTGAFETLVTLSGREAPCEIASVRRGGGAESRAG